MTVEFFLRRMRNLAPLASTETRFLESIIQNPILYESGRDIVRKGEKTSRLHVFLDGWACRYVDMPNGERQIIACLLPGEISNRYVGPAGRFNYSVATLSSCNIAAIEGHLVEEIATDNPNIARALWLSSLMDEAIAREWLVSLGRRSATDRLAHLLCEICLRLRAVDLVKDGAFEFPVTQTQLADMTGITVVHVNRTLSKLRSSGLIDYRPGWMKIVAFDELADLCAFDPAYLGYDLSKDESRRAL